MRDRGKKGGRKEDREGGMEGGMEGGRLVPITYNDNVHLLKS